MTTDSLVNGYYPIDYLQLLGIDRIKAPDAGWWSSKQRFAAVAPGTTNTYQRSGVATSEILELDLGRVRPLNWIGGDVLRVPLDVKIEYDSVSASDGSHQWVEVRALEGMPFVERVHYDANNRNAWLASEWYLTDPLGNMVVTRFLRITFTRRDVTWPTNKSDAFPYAVAAKHLRVGRYVINYQDTMGTLFNVGADASQEYQFERSGPGSIISKEVRQQFQLPDTTIRTDDTAAIVPSLLGVGFLVPVAGTEDNALLTTSPNALDVSYSWELWDVSDPLNPAKLRWGTAIGAPNMDGRTWIDVYWTQSPVRLAAADVDPLTQRTFELRVRSRNLFGSEGIFLVSPSKVPGDFDASYPEAINAGIGNACLCMRLWADVGEFGRDVLGNSYRYGAYRNIAAQVTNDDDPGWMSAPRPSPEAVEALYFDVRTLDDADALSPTVIDAIRVAPRTPGVHMHVYWTNQHGQGDAPATPEEYDMLTWTPVSQTFVLRRDDIYTLPSPIHATFVKLEFTALRPSDMKIPRTPKLPPVTYRRYPTWVELQFSPTTYGLAGTGLRAAIQHFWQDATPVERRILDEIRKRGEGKEYEFQYKLREYLMALLGKFDKDDRKIGIAAGLIDPKSQTFIDPITASRIQLDDRGNYRQTLTVSVNHDSLLGQMVQSRFDPIVNTDTNEIAPRYYQQDGVANVSTTNDRITESFSNLAQTPMWFNRVCKHIYKYEKSSFNLKAYIVGIKRVEFFRQDYTIARDDPFIFDNLADDALLSDNNFQIEQGSRITLFRDQGETDPTLLDVSYIVNGVRYIDTVVAEDVPQLLPSGVGGVAQSVVVTDHYSSTQFYAGDDYDMQIGKDDSGLTVNYIMRSQLPARLIVPITPVVYNDSGIVAGLARISAVESYTKGS